MKLHFIHVSGFTFIITKHEMSKEYIQINLTNYFYTSNDVWITKFKKPSLVFSSIHEKC